MGNHLFKIARAAKLRAHIRVWLILLAILPAGCDKAPSSDFATKALTLEARIMAAGDGKTTVSVKVLVGDFMPGEVLVESGDGLQVTAYGITRPVTNSGSSAFPKYTTTFDSDAAGTFNIALTRPSLQLSAPNSTVGLPAPIQVTPWASNRELSPGDSFEVAWTPDGVQTTFAVTGHCNGVTNGTAATTRGINFGGQSNTGSMTIAVSQLIGNSPLASSESCSAEVTLLRRIYGEVDPNFDGGEIIAEQFRKVGGVTISP